MRVLVIGQGGREHALIWKLAHSPSVTALYCAPGNAGTGIDAKNVDIKENDDREFAYFVNKERIDLVVIGPEAPLVAGLADKLREEGVAVFGPSAAAAELEGSKIFSKRLMRKANVPTAKFQVFEHFDQAAFHFGTHPGPCVVKADGLAAGKGAIVCENAEEATEAARRILVREEFGAAGRQILVEERLTGVEVSILAITDGKTIAILDPCQDHKRAFNGDLGPNTGGMGAYCPAPVLSREHLQMVEKDIFIPVLHQMSLDRRPFQGVLYAGLMVGRKGPRVLEFNVRFGDPECQPLLMRLQNDLGELLMAASTGRLGKHELKWDPRPSVCVVMASEGYPGSYTKGIPIRGLDDVANIPDVKVFHAGTKMEGERIVTNGGRVLGVTALGETISDAKRAAQDAIAKIKFTGAMYRTDIGDKMITPSED